MENGAGYSSRTPALTMVRDGRGGFVGIRYTVDRVRRVILGALHRAKLMAGNLSRYRRTRGKTGTRDNSEHTWTSVMERRRRPGGRRGGRHGDQKLRELYRRQGRRGRLPGVSERRGEKRWKLFQGVPVQGIEDRYRRVIRGVGKSGKEKGAVTVRPIRRRTSSFRDQRDAPRWRVGMNTQAERKIHRRYRRCNHRQRKGSIRQRGNKNSQGNVRVSPSSSIFRRSRIVSRRVARSEIRKVGDGIRER